MKDKPRPGGRAVRKGTVFILKRAAFITLILVMAVGHGGSGVAGVGGARYGGSRLVRFPLWKDVPGGPFAVLGRSNLNGGQWEAFASRSSRRRKSRLKPCITVAGVTRLSDYGNAGSCGPLAPAEGKKHPPIHPLLGGSSGTFFAVSLRRDVLRVEIELGSGRMIDRKTKALSSAQVDKTNLAPFRFVVVSLKGDACIAKVAGFSYSDEQVLEAVTNEC